MSFGEKIFYCDKEVGFFITLLVSNRLVGLGLAIIIGSWGRENQEFKWVRAGQLRSLLILTAIGLADFKGGLIGINTAILSTSEGSIGLGFAILVNTVRDITRQPPRTTSFQMFFIER